MSSYSPSPFPTSCRPIPSALAPPTTFTEEFLPPYFYFSLIGFTAFHESLDLCVAFRDKYPRSQRREDQVTAVFLQDRAHLVASLACVYAIAGFRDRIHENALKAARADVDAMLELMTDDFVGAWGPSRVPGACTRRRQALIRAAQRAQGAAYYAARLQQAQDAAELAHQADADIHQAPLVLDDQPVSLPSTWGTATTSEGGWGVPTTTTSQWGMPSINNNGWGWGWTPHRRQRHAPRVWPLRSWSRHMGRLARPPTRYGPRRRRRRRTPALTFDAFTRRVTVLLARAGRRVLGNGLVQ